MINEFINRCVKNNKTALIYKNNNRFVKQSFNDFYLDCLKMKSLFEENINTSDKVLVFSYPYSYSFYVAMFAGFMSGLNLVIFDSYKDKDKINKMLEESACNKVLVDNVTRFLSFKLPKHIDGINISKYKYFNESNSEAKKNATITTFTSGTTGNPKPIIRDLSFLSKQIELIKANIEIEDYDLVYGMLPMYTMLSLFLGNTTCICRNALKIKKLNPTVLLTPIRNVLSLKDKLLSVKKCFLGGAILYSKEAKRIKLLLPNADITYVYGASEGALIYKTKLDRYIDNPFSFDKCIDGINAEIMNPNEAGIGEIAIKGNTVISSLDYHYTGDYGKIDNGILSIVGRKKYSLIGEAFYNYLEDETIINNNPYLKKGFSFAYCNNKYVAYEGQISKKMEGFIYLKMNKLPMDLKHKTKLDYAKVIKMKI